ncbi:cyclin dependent kinase inhibitor 1Bb [Paralichthys olivaceus]|uniref:cyclin dependent kinase inhibitor 1Bb n=1 Tax=Paralichthys olivaceus TaxID=8255 RepID=UPI00097D7C16|nr:PREDICTED: cyclin-dependent kinase inhibitor 1B [Paralichthys olivaceus]XP_019935082.1 PREDICTED: cyclin-dependent kinase inhibitor 1B [Paralichthys olivaceus]
MSNVRLSNGSPTLERTDPRVSEHPKPSACRSLFGSVDHEELNRDLKGHFREMEETASAKWGFDFARHSPLVNDRLEWELVDCRDVPDFYHRPLRPRSREKGVCSAGNNNVDLNGNHSCVVVAAPGDDSARSDGQMECTGLRKRPACHEASAQNKRSHSSSSSSEEVISSLSHSAEHTPRKSSPKRLT